MLSLLIRIAAFVAAVAILVDGFLPSTFESAQVDRHIARNNYNTNRYGHRTHDTSYDLEFSGSRADSCSVGYTTYNALHDGDSVTVQMSRIFRDCIAIQRDGEMVYRDSGRRFGSALMALVLLAISFGWLQWFDRYDDDDDRRGWWWSWLRWFWDD